MEASSFDVESSCRACLAPSDSLESIFTAPPDDKSLQFSEILSLLLSEVPQIQPGDGLSQVICGSCRVHAVTAYKFQEMCRQNDRHARQLLEIRSNIKVEMRDEKKFVESMDGDVLMADLKPLEDDFETETMDNFDDDDEESNEDSSTSESRKFNCDSCDQQFQTEKKLEQHTKNEHGDDEETDSDEETRIYSCDLCPKKFKKPSLLSRHLKTHDPNKRPHECTKCQKRFPSQVALVRHDILHSELVERSKISRPEPQDFLCVVCGRAFKSSESLMTHLKSHKNRNDDGDFTCKLCHDSFPTFGDIVRHSKNHIENATHQCAICNKLFVVGDELIDHFLRHKGMKPHQCPVCEKSFLKLHKLNVHMRTHSDDKVRFGVGWMVAEIDGRFVSAEQFLVSRVRQKPVDERKSQKASDSTHGNKGEGCKV